MSCPGCLCVVQVCTLSSLLPLPLLGLVPNTSGSEEVRGEPVPRRQVGRNEAGLHSWPCMLGAARLMSDFGALKIEF